MEACGFRFGRIHAKTVRPKLYKLFMSTTTVFTGSVVPPVGLAQDVCHMYAFKTFLLGTKGTTKDEKWEIDILLK